MHAVVHKNVAFSTGTRAFHRPKRRACAAEKVFSRARHSVSPQQSAGRDEAVRVAPHGFGQHENPICARPRRLSPAITASNFVSVLLSTCRSTFIARHLASPHRRVSRHSRSTLPSTCSHHTWGCDVRARGQNLETTLVHKKLALSTAFRSNFAQFTAFDAIRCGGGSA